MSAGACRRRVNGAKLGGGVMWHPLCGRVLTLHLCVSLCVCVCVCVCVPAVIHLPSDSSARILAYAHTETHSIVR